jgi:choline dehydrogenase
MRQGVQLVRRVGAAFGPSVLGKELSPGQDVQSDQSIEDWLLYDNNGANSQFHPAGTCSMLPKNLGGVVDANLKVYGICEFN